MGFAQDLVNKGYYGYAGWGDAEAAADFKATGGAGKGGSSSSSSSSVNVTPQSFTQNPVQSAIDIAKALREQNISAAQPAIQTLQTGQQPLTDRYNKIIEDIKGRRETALTQTGITTATEFGKRGIPLSSGAYDVALRGAQTPVEQAYGQTITGAEGELQDKQAAIRAAIASLQSGAGNVSMSDALNILTTSKALEKPAVQPIQLGEGATLFDPTTGKAIYTAPKTFAPTNSLDLTGLAALFGGGSTTTPTEPKPTTKPTSSATTSRPLSTNYLGNVFV